MFPFSYTRHYAKVSLQEFANSHVRNKLHVIPEDSGPRISEVREAKRWLSELDPELTTPWMGIGKQDFYTFEPALATGDRFCVPVQWFEREKEVFAKCWDLKVVVRDGVARWRAVPST